MSESIFSPVAYKNDWPSSKPPSMAWKIMVEKFRQIFQVGALQTASGLKKTLGVRGFSFSGWATEYVRSFELSITSVLSRRTWGMVSVSKGWPRAFCCLFESFIYTHHRSGARKAHSAPSISQLREKLAECECLTAPGVCKDLQSSLFLCPIGKVEAFHVDSKSRVKSSRDCNLPLQGWIWDGKSL